jgi:AhpD family alkylhydroperoxidase
MSRKDTERDIIEVLGEVPPWFASMPDETLAREWDEFKSFQLADTAIPAKYKHLIGLGVAAATHCPYCTYFHKSAATMLGASERECEEASRFASDTAKYSAYLHGLQTDITEFKAASDRMGEHMRRQQAEMAA